MAAALWSQLFASPPTPRSSSPPRETQAFSSSPPDPPPQIQTNITSLHLRAFTLSLARQEQQLAATTALLNECKSVFSTAVSAAAGKSNPSKKANDKDAAALDSRLSGIESAVNSLTATVRGLTEEMRLHREQLRTLGMGLPAVIQVPASDPANYNQVSPENIAGVKTEDSTGPIAIAKAHQAAAQSSAQWRLPSIDDDLDLPENLVQETQPIPPASSSDLKPNSPPAPETQVAALAEKEPARPTPKAPTRKRRLLSSDEEVEFPPQDDRRLPLRGKRPRVKMPAASPPAEVAKLQERAKRSPSLEIVDLVVPYESRLSTGPDRV
ncbi:hypothetical protein FN846DRAFT_914174 [Sphaerosporella brunnea]|uniref:Uncharacterized protein n=1 Tax=Sphaerosporella brunnea TaxID=1250544 RepID=A0A5J5EF21_9PEZI|nr:hypothetical protein FN846DRAFT_914174 [Sphaerosporella brunnea]